MSDPRELVRAIVAGCRSDAAGVERLHWPLADGGDDWDAFNAAG